MASDYLPIIIQPESLRKKLHDKNLELQKYGDINDKLIPILELKEE